ncbi:MAG: zinc ribbon domain-containing protein [Phycisphaerae bacterium]
MPIYEYECPACGATFEQLIRSKRDERAAVCSACGSREVTRRLSVFSAHASASKPSAGRAGCEGCWDSHGRCPLESLAPPLQS